MVRHVVTFRFTADATDEQIDGVTRELGVKLAVAEVLSMRYGRDLGLSPDTFDLVVLADFATAKDYITYRDHPAHRRFQTEILTPVLAGRSATQVFLHDV